MFGFPAEELCVKEPLSDTLESSSVLQKVQKVFLSLLFPRVSTRRKALGNCGGTSRDPSLWEEAWQVQQSAWVQFGRQTAHLNQHLHFHTSHWPTFTSILMQPSTEPKDLVAYGNFPFPTPPNVLSNAESAKGAEPRENPLLPEQIHAIHLGTAWSIPTWCLMKWREVGGTSNAAAAAAYTVTALGVSRGLQSQVCHSGTCQQC